MDLCDFTKRVCTYLHLCVGAPVSPQRRDALLYAFVVLFLHLILPQNVPLTTTGWADPHLLVKNMQFMYFSLGIINTEYSKLNELLEETKKILFL